MTQQQIIKLLDLPERTLRDWKKSRNRLYTLLENIEYEEAKSKIDVVDLDDTIEFNPNAPADLFGQVAGVIRTVLK